MLRPFRSPAASYPMTLAETASDFTEMILLSGMKSDPNLAPGMKAYLLDQEMLRAHAYLINIPMRHEFEKAFYTERAHGEMRVSRPHLAGLLGRGPAHHRAHVGGLRKTPELSLE